VIKLATQNRATQFLVSLPLPRRISDEINVDARNFSDLRNAFNAAIVANCSGNANVECCDNDNVGGDQKHYSADSIQVWYRRCTLSRPTVSGCSFFS
jgi:hypothetical protein